MKQTYQMTSEEFYSAVGRLPVGWEQKGWKKIGDLIISPIGNRFLFENGKLYRPFNRNYHKYAVRRALEQKIRISKRVLAEYPDLTQATPQKKTRHTHLYCGKSFSSLARAQAHAQRGTCKPSKATLRCLAAKERTLRIKVHHESTRESDQTT